MSLMLNSNVYLEPTPAGAYYAVSSLHSEPARRVLLAILGERTQPHSDPRLLSMWSGLEPEESLGLLKRLQDLRWLSGVSEPQSAPIGPLEEVLPDLLEQVSIEGKALLADDQGFYLSTCGLPHETAEALSALSADLGSLYDRHKLLLMNNMGMKEQNWSISTAAGNAQLGFWPLYIGSQRFVLAIQGRPTLNQPAFRDLVWVLCLRYSNPFIATPS